MIKILKDKMEFVKVTNGNEDPINQALENFNVLGSITGGIYSVKIKYLINKIDIKIKKNPEVNYKEMFLEDNSDIHRGKIGFAKKGNINIDIDLFVTQPPELPEVPLSFDPEL